MGAVGPRKRGVRLRLVWEGVYVREWVWVCGLLGLGCVRARERVCGVPLKGV